MSTTEVEEHLAQTPGARSSRLMQHLSDVRFWIVQTLVLVVTVIHGLVEFAESNGDLPRLSEGLHSLPVEAYILPVVLAGWWFGLEGGLFTGLLALVLSVPNLLAFHRDDFGWLGELSANAFVIGVGIMVAYMVEREARSREAAEATSRRLETIHRVTSALNRTDQPSVMVDAVLKRLNQMSTVKAAVFVPNGGLTVDDPALTQALLAGADDDRPRPSGELAMPDGRSGGSTWAQFAVSTSQSNLGTLYVDCSDSRLCQADEAMLSHVARELAYALENVDMLERERSHLHGYARAVIVAQERERRRIARDLHDGAAQLLVVLARGLGRLSESTHPAAEAEKEATELREVAREALRSIRRTTWALRPALLDLGLVPAVESLVDHQNRRGDAVVDVRVKGELRRLDDDVEVAAFRIVQEALSNVDRHAAASTATVTVEFLEDALSVKVGDNGVGFDPLGREGRDTIGLTGMQERAELVGGRLELESREGTGTLVTFRTPG